MKVEIKKQSKNINISIEIDRDPPIRFCIQPNIEHIEF